ncbi:MAG: hypothetical protein ABW298_04945 [Candidatus Binatia bacterium]
MRVRVPFVEVFDAPNGRQREGGAPFRPARGFAVTFRIGGRARRSQLRPGLRDGLTA